MRVLITGAGGQLGRELLQCVPPGIEVTAHDQAGLDITDEEAVFAAISGGRPDLVINAAAYTAVDRAEEDADRAFAINAQAVEFLAVASAELGARLIQISTDYVFDGSHSTPYAPADRCTPLGIYGTSKYEGERNAIELTDGQVLIIRTAWLYSRHNVNFVKTMLRLMAERERLGVVADQVGTPTWARTLAEAVWGAAQRPELSGIYHWTDAGVASWYDFAVAIQEEALALGLLTRAIPIQPIATTDYPTPAQRPAYSVLDKSDAWRDFGVSACHWRVALREMLKEIAHG